MMNYFRYIALLILVSGTVFAQEATRLTKDAEISVLTCSPGMELYSGFGHSAIRLKDNEANVDYVFNFGTFNFGDPNFYMKFARGKLMYYLSITDYESFGMDYKYEGRGIHEQVLELTQEEKQKIFEHLISIFNSEERYYRYDFLDNNCTTKIYEILKAVLGERIVLHQEIKKKSYRKLLYPYLENKKWAKLGIDILLGLPTDKKPDKEEYLFLPDYLESGLDHATIDGKPFVKEKRILLGTVRNKEKSSNTPLMILSGLLVLVVILRMMRLKIILKIFDAFYFPIISLLFILLIFMWFFTDHDTTPYNLDIIWTGALPLLGIWKKRTKKPGGRIHGLLFLIFLAMIIASILGFVNFAVIPLFFIGMIRIKSIQK